MREVTERFLAAAVGGDVTGLLAVLAPDVVLLTDGGGVSKAALRPIVGAEKAARFLVATGAQAASEPELRIELVEVNGTPGIVAWNDAGPFLAASLVVVSGRAQQVLVARNPDKLRGLGALDLGSSG